MLLTVGSFNDSLEDSPGRLNLFYRVIPLEDLFNDFCKSVFLDYLRSSSLLKILVETPLSLIFLEILSKVSFMTSFSLSLIFSEVITA
jgi:hypothetical protein